MLIKQCSLNNAHYRSGLPSRLSANCICGYGIGILLRQLSGTATSPSGNRLRWCDNRAALRLGRRNATLLGVLGTLWLDELGRCEAVSPAPMARHSSDLALPSA